MKRKVISIPPNYFYFCIALSIVLFFVFSGVNKIKYPYNLFGLILIGAGFYLIGKSWYLFKEKGTPESFAPSTHLVTGHLFKYSRNPMYAGGVIFLFGLSILLGNLYSFVSPIIFFLIINYMFIPFEEEKNEKTFGQEFLNYKKQVRRWL